MYKRQHQDGLVHISEMTERFIKHPLEAVSVGDIVDVRVIGVDTVSYTHLDVYKRQII